MKLHHPHKVAYSQTHLDYCVHFPLFVAIVITLLLIFSSAASASLSGDASLTYSNYKGSDSTYSKSSSSLSQNYSLLYTKSGPIYNSRVGNYSVALGYNWTALDTTFKSFTEPDENYSEKRSKIKYLGELKVDPKEIPFKLTAYSRDMGNNTFIASEIGSQPFASLIGGNIQPYDIKNGLHIETGATLIAGVKNGMTNGYNEILRHFPMILVDYKDTINQDYRSLAPVDDRLSRLAFVSLNKKDNWFHYRHTLYEDKINASNNYEENQFQLGTVDQNLARRWIDFSNWIKVSTDMTISTRKNTVPPNQTEEINLNLFVAAERKNWNAKTFSSFTRNVDESKNLTYSTMLPAYFSGVVDSNLSWNVRTSYRDNQELNSSGVAHGYTNMLFGYRVNAFKRAPFTLSQSFDVETSTSNSSDLLTLSGGLETASTKLFSRTVKLEASYNVRSSSTSSTSVVSNVQTTGSSDFLMQVIKLNAGYVPGNTLRFDFRQTSTLTQGAVVSFGGQTQLSAFSGSNISSTDVGSKSYQSLSSFSTTWVPKPRLNVNFLLEEDISESDVQGHTSVTSALSEVTFASAVWDAKNKFKYTRSDRGTSNNNLSSTISNTSTIRYNHSRRLNASAAVTYLSTSSAGEDTGGTSFEQALAYSHYTTSGIVRKIFEVNESLSYSVGKPRSAYPSRNTVALGFRYYPITRLTLAAGVTAKEFRFSDPFNDSLVWNASVAANFKLMQASVDYVSAFRNTDKVRERKLTGNIRKSF